MTSEGTKAVLPKGYILALNDLLRHYPASEIAECCELDLGVIEAASRGECLTPEQVLTLKYNIREYCEP